MLTTFAAVRIEAQISPGPLARAHAKLEGPANCAQCHGLRREPMTNQCLSCHKEIRWLLDRNRGYHAREARTSGKQCAQCHPDHAGADFALIEWPGGSRERFDHSKTGWSLEGSHLEVKCQSCHAGKFRVAPVAALSERTSDAGWIGLETTCISCHRDDDVHRGDLQARCETCHDARKWSHAPGFDHEKTDYPLTGKHATVKCAGCHITSRLPVRSNAAGERVGTFKPVPYRECSSCHADPHRGALSAQCSNCHVTRGFDVIDRSGFDHQLTKYPLKGRHASVKCESCHGANLSNRRPAYATCGACHADVHAGEATLRGAPADCGACHSVVGFAPSSFTVAQHRQTNYPLDGRHASVKCTLCHTPRRNENAGSGPVQRVARLHLEASRCTSCHQDAHGGELVARADKGACESCHTTSGFAPSSFGVTEHAALRVTLEGKHGKVGCAACHGPSRPGLAPLPKPPGRHAPFTITLHEVECAACHVDPHAAPNEKATTPTCTTCHNAVQWRPATVTVATHASFSWPLDGAHRAVPCVGCHAEYNARQAPNTLRRSAHGVAALPFARGRTTTCASCHESPHGAQFTARRDQGACDGCHVVAAFAPASRFDHERDAAFSLKGAHASVPCTSCHRSANPGAAVVYRPLASTCESCHSGSLPRSRS